MNKTLIVGGGAAGTLVAINLLRSDQKMEVTIAEPNELLGRGLAYGTSDPAHLLNVPAGRMSALVTAPRHLCEWAHVDENTFIPRRDYGRYLAELLAESSHTGAGSETFRHLRRTVTDLEVSSAGFTAHFDDGSSESFTSVVLATGNSAALLPRPLNEISSSPRIILDMWRTPITGDFKRIALLGTGLSFYDAALSMLRDRPKAKLIAISRTGLLPSPHLKVRAAALPVPDLVRSSAQAIRDYLVGVGERWREAQDGIRHDLQEIWAGFPDHEKELFLNQHFRWWNSLRHRSAPEIDEAIKGAIAVGQIEILATGLESVVEIDEGLRLRLTDGSEIFVDQLINCAGNQLVATAPLLENLIGNGLLVRGPLGLGVGCDPATLRLRSANGKVHENLYGIGPILVGELFETTAIPEIREEAALIAESIAS